MVDPNPERYILILSVGGGWPDEGLVPDPGQLQKKLREASISVISVRAAERAQNPTAIQQRYYDVEAESSLPPAELKDALVDALEQTQAGMWVGLEIQVTLTNAEGRTVAEGTATPPPR